MKINFFFNFLNNFVKCYDYRYFFMFVKLKVIENMLWWLKEMGKIELLIMNRKWKFRNILFIYMYKFDKYKVFWLFWKFFLF